MVLHELTTNAVKYGALSVPSGRLRVEWSRGETHLEFRWSEADARLSTRPSIKASAHEWSTGLSNKNSRGEMEQRFRDE